MQPVDFFRSRIDAMINLNDPLAVLATRLPWIQIETAIAAKFEHQNRVGQVLQCEDMFGTTQTVIGGGRSNAGRSKLAIRLMASLADKTTVVRNLFDFKFLLTARSLFLRKARQNTHRISGVAGAVRSS